MKEDQIIRNATCAAIMFPEFARRYEENARRGTLLNWARAVNATVDLLVFDTPRLDASTSNGEGRSAEADMGGKNGIVEGQHRPSEVGDAASGNAELSNSALNSVKREPASSGPSPSATSVKSPACSAPGRGVRDATEGEQR